MSVATKVARFPLPLPDKWKAVVTDLLPPVLLRAAKAVTRQVVPTLPPYERDGFLWWLTWITPGNLIENNLPLFNHAIQKMPDHGAVVEIRIMVWIVT